MGRVAEVFARDAQQFGVAAGCVIQVLHLQPRHGGGVMLLEMFMEQHPQIALAMAMAQQQHPIGLQHRVAEFV